MDDYQILDEAIALLESPNLVWSDDFEAIRNHLWAMLKDERKSLAPYEATFDLAKELLDGFHNDFQIG
jgi:hypothetical protein